MLAEASMGSASRIVAAVSESFSVASTVTESAVIVISRLLKCVGLFRSIVPVRIGMILYLTHRRLRAEVAVRFGM